jgi:hypothetical protein
MKSELCPLLKSHDWQALYTPKRVVPPGFVGGTIRIGRQIPACISCAKNKYLENEE